MPRDAVTLAIAQPLTHGPARREEDVDLAVDLIGRAAQRGAELVLFPEHFPGPFTAAEHYDASPAMIGAARRHAIAVCWSRMERCGDGWWRLAVYVHDAAGTQLLRYERAHPATVPPQDTGGWVAPGPVLGAVEICGVPMAVVVCSELWIPEATRVLALGGAEVILSPAGGNFTSLTDNWQLIARARAVENHCYVALTNNRYGPESGAAMIAGPEHVVAESGRAELVVSTLDLARARWLRDHDDQLASVKPFDSIPGLLRARRPELYAALAAPAAGLYDYLTPPADPLAMGAGSGSEGAGA